MTATFTNDTTIIASDTDGINALKLQQTQTEFKTCPTNGKSTQIKLNICKIYS